MDTTNINRLVDLASGEEPWEAAIMNMGRAVRDHIMEEMQRKFNEMGNHIYAEISKRIDQVVKAAIDKYTADTRHMIEAIPASVKMAVAGVPEVIVQTPRRRVKKKIEYDVMNRPIEVTEEEVLGE